jgi:phosphocarrier protein HPr
MIFLKMTNLFVKNHRDTVQSALVKTIELTVKVKNDQGLHARPAAALTKILQGCKSKVTISHRKQTADARSILSILMMAITKNSEVVLTIEGEDAEETARRLTRAFDTQFGELEGY